MDNLFIQIVNGQPVNNPAAESNLIAAFGSVPSDWQPFIRVEQPVVGLYKVLDPPTSTYQMVNGSWSDVWTLRDMTPDEKASYQQEVEAAWAARPYASNFTTWAFDAPSGAYIPPVPRPMDGQNYRWSGPDNNWKVAPSAPTDGGAYQFNFTTWTWEPIQQGT